MKKLTDIEMKGSSEMILVELSNRLSCKVGELLHTYQKGMLNFDDVRLWKKYYKGQLTIWFGTVWPDFKSSCYTLMKHYPHSEALRNIATVKITGMTTDKDRWTKGDAFKEVFANLKDALIDCGKQDVADKLFAKYDQLIQFIEDNKDDFNSEPSSTSYYSGTAKAPKQIARTSVNIELQVNVQLMKLPKDLYQQAREFVFKDNNLERNLQQFKQQHNLS